MAITPTLLLLVAPTAFAFVPAPRLVPRTAHFSPRLVIRTPVAPVAFADQAGTLAGTFFQASLLPYIGFLYFLGYAPNNTPKQALFGFQFLLLFVLSTVFTGIVTKSVYGASLANTDWLHGAAEALLTTSNLYVASGFRNALAGEAAPEGPSFRFPALAIFALVVAATAAGPSLGVEQHSAFLYGIGNLGENPLAGVLDSVRSLPGRPVLLGAITLDLLVVLLGGATADDPTQPGIKLISRPRLTSSAVLDGGRPTGDQRGVR
jgi:hypothetical protein